MFSVVIYNACILTTELMIRTVFDELDLGTFSVIIKQTDRSTWRPTDGSEKFGNYREYSNCRSYCHCNNNRGVLNSPIVEIHFNTLTKNGNKMREMVKKTGERIEPVKIVCGTHIGRKTSPHRSFKWERYWTLWLLSDTNVRIVYPGEDDVIEEYDEEYDEDEEEDKEDDEEEEDEEDKVECITFERLNKMNYGELRDACKTIGIEPFRIMGTMEGAGRQNMNFQQMMVALIEKLNLITLERLNEMNIEELRDACRKTISEISFRRRFYNKEELKAALIEKFNL